MYRLVLLALVAVAAADHKCGHVNTVDNFNYEEFASGSWYELARYKNSPGEVGQCGKSTYTMQDDKTFKINDCHIVNGKKVCMSAAGRLCPEANNHGVLITTYPHGPNGAMVDGTLNIIDTDYKNYAIYYFCKHDEERNVHYDLAWVMGRNKSLSDEVREKVTKIIKDAAFLDSDSFQKLDFSEEACKITA